MKRECQRWRKKNIVLYTPSYLRALIANNTNLNMKSVFFVLNSSTLVRIGNMKLVQHCQGLIRCSEVDRLPTRACELSSLPLLKIENDPFLRNYRATENESFIIWAVRAWSFGVPFVIRVFSCSTTKGQIISEWLLDVFIWTKTRTKIFLYFCPSL